MPFFPASMTQLDGKTHLFASFIEQLKALGCMFSIFALPKVGIDLMLLMFKPLCFNHIIFFHSGRISFAAEAPSWYLYQYKTKCVLS